jgi:hypothetical protein
VRRLIITAAGVAIACGAAFVPLPGIDASAIGKGALLQSVSIGALGIAPIFLGLELVLFFAGRKRDLAREARLYRIGVFVGVLIAAVQALSIAIYLAGTQLFAREMQAVATITLVAAAVAIFAVAQAVSVFGTGHGVIVIATVPPLVLAFPSFLAFFGSEALSPAERLEPVLMIGAIALVTWRALSRERVVPLQGLEPMHVGAALISLAWTFAETRALLPGTAAYAAALTALSLALTVSFARWRKEPLRGLSLTALFLAFLAAAPCFLRAGAALVWPATIATVTAVIFDLVREARALRTDGWRLLVEIADLNVADDVTKALAAAKLAAFCRNVSARRLVRFAGLGAPIAVFVSARDFAAAETVLLTIFQTKTARSVETVST